MTLYAFQILPFVLQEVINLIPVAGIFKRKFFSHPNINFEDLLDYHCVCTYYNFVRNSFSRQECNPRKQ